MTSTAEFPECASVPWLLLKVIGTQEGNHKQQLGCLTAYMQACTQHTS